MKSKRKSSVNAERMTTHEEVIQMQKAADKKKPPFYWNMPWNVVREINKLGYTFTWKNIASVYISMLGLIGVLCFAFKLHLPYVIVCLIAGIVVSPKFIMNRYKNKYEMTRFNDVNTYIEQMLYAFANSNRVLTALKDVSVLFKECAMREVIDNAIDMIQQPNANNEADVEELALNLIAERYPNQYIRQMHRFVLKVERVGGDFDNAIKLLIQNRVNWQARTDYIIAEEKKKLQEILISCCCGIGLVIVMLYMLLTSDVSIFSDNTVQMFNVFIIIISLLIYQKADSRLALSLVKSRDERSEEVCQKDYDKFINYDKKKGFIQSLKFSIAPFAIAIIYAITTVMKTGTMSFGNFAILGIIVGIALLMEFQAELGHKIQKKRMQSEIMSAFPEWMLEMSLLLQSDNVQVSIFKSEETVQPMLKPELHRMINDIKEHPSEPEPFLNFCYIFDLPSVMTSMQMLYSLSIGSGGEPQAQIRNIVERNNRDMDQTERAKCQNRLASMTLLFFLPVLTASIVLMVDMMIFLTIFMGTMNVGRFTEGDGVEVSDQSMDAERTNKPDALDGMDETGFTTKDGKKVYYDANDKLYVIEDGEVILYDESLDYDGKFYDFEDNSYHVSDFVGEKGFMGMHDTGFYDKNANKIYYDNHGKTFIIDGRKPVIYANSVMYDKNAKEYQMADFMGIDGFRGVTHSGFYDENGNPIYYDKNGDLFIIDNYNHTIDYDKSLFYDVNGVQFEVADFIGTDGFKGMNYTGLKDQYGHDIYYDNNGNTFTIDDYNRTIIYDKSIGYDTNGHEVDLSGIKNAFNGLDKPDAFAFNGTDTYRGVNKFIGVDNPNSLDKFNGVAPFEGIPGFNGVSYFGGVNSQEEVDNIHDVINDGSDIIDDALDNIGQ